MFAVNYQFHENDTWSGFAAVVSDAIPSLGGASNFQWVYYDDENDAITIARSVVVGIVVVVYCLCLLVGWRFSDFGVLG